MKEMQYIAIEQLHPHPDNPRKELGDLTELSASIKSSGIYQNLTVVPRKEGGYTVVIGHRRRAAAKLAGLTELPCIVTDMSYKEQLSTMLLENMQRSDLTVYEQAQGFQMMLDLGDTVSTIAQSTGLSETTVRRRVKLLALDPAKFQKATARGATLFEFAELDKIKDIEARNRLLDTIGTVNFANQLKAALEKQKKDESLAAQKEVLDKFAFRIEEVNKFGGIAVSMKYVGGYYGNGTEVRIPEDSENVRYFYMSSNYGLSLYKEITETQRDTAAEREKQRLRGLHGEHERLLQDMTERHYSLRCDFVKDFGGGKTGAELIAAFAARAITAGEVTSYYNTTKKVYRMFGLEADEETEYQAEHIDRIVEKEPIKSLLCVLAAYTDGADNGYWRNEWKPETQLYEVSRKGNPTLDRWYELLCSLGYEMSDEEREMQNGTAAELDFAFVEGLG